MTFQRLSTVRLVAYLINKFWAISTMNSYWSGWGKARREFEPDEGFFVLSRIICWGILVIH